jgi:predicted  nucleic acid-binding Zn-ribbon protein
VVIEFTGDLVAEVIIGTGLITLSLVIWNASRRITTMEVCLANQGKEMLEIKNQIKTEHEADIKRVELEISNAKSERIKQIGDAKLDLKDDFTTMQKQIDSVRADVKDANTRVTVVSVKVDAHEAEQQKLHDRINDNLKFITDWNQRIEDRIKEAENKAIALVESAKRDLISMFHERGSKKNEDTG